LILLKSWMVHAMIGRKKHSGVSHPHVDARRALDSARELARKAAIVDAHPKIPVLEMKRRIRDGLAELLLTRGFHQARGDEFGWVKEDGPGVLQIVGVQFLDKYVDLELPAKLGVGLQLVEMHRLWAFAHRILDSDETDSESESDADIGRPLNLLMGVDPLSTWSFLRHEIDLLLLQDMRRALVEYGLPFLEAYRSREAVAAELVRQHEAAKPTYAGELRFACLEFSIGQKEQAIQRVARALASFDPARRGNLAERSREMGRALLAHFAAN
jgi:hypothetical protein